MLQRTITALIAAVSVAPLATPAFAQGGRTDTDQFDVSIHVQTQCILAINNLNFGVATDLAVAKTADTQGAVMCSTNVPAFEISFDIGTGGGTFQARQMRLDETGVLGFNIYRDNAHTEILGNGQNGTVKLSATAAAPDAEQRFTVFGRTNPTDQSIPGGEYKSTITATLTY